MGAINQRMASLTAPTARERTITHARELVFTHGQAATGVEGWIASSWQRCIDSGFMPQQSIGFNLVTSAHQRRMREANHLLKAAATPTLEQLARTMEPIGYFAILTNAQGIVVASEGAQVNRYQGDRRASLITREGVDLSERAIGTSAIGATLHEQADVWLHRGEHFFDATGCYSCAGSPIFSGSGDCVGMLDVTGIDVPERPELIHLVASAARRIENQLVLGTPHTLVVHLRWPGAAVAGREAEGLVCLGADGEVHAMNSTARQMLGLLHLSTRPQLASELFATDTHRLYDLALASQAITVPLWSGLHVELRTSRSGKLAPKVVPSVDTRTRQSVGALREHETDVIRDTVAQLKGNVAAAAHKLGISRATIYRKLGKR
jgi:sigma-54 dependent transcriptional regulator, acetoin dehydrogenase operon transcriptional activator AcoR